MGAPVAQIYGSFATKNWLVLLERNVAVNASAISDRKIGEPARVEITISSYNNARRFEMRKVAGVAGCRTATAFKLSE